jgi:hypothetical protein
VRNFPVFGPFSRRRRNASECVTDYEMKVAEALFQLPALQHNYAVFAQSNSFLALRKAFLVDDFGATNSGNLFTVSPDKGQFARSIRHTRVWMRR